MDSGYRIRRYPLFLTLYTGVLEMPLYDFRCEHCEGIFEQRVPIARISTDTIECQYCKQQTLAKPIQIPLMRINIVNGIGINHIRSRCSSLHTYSQRRMGYHLSMNWDIQQSKKYERTKATRRF